MQLIESAQLCSYLHMFRQFKLEQVMLELIPEEF